MSNYCSSCNIASFKTYAAARRRHLIGILIKH
jgi:hypothetical protein